METNTTELVGAQTKRDTKGHRIINAQRRDELLARYQSSGLTQKAFARQAGVNFHTFVSWLAQQRCASAAASAAPAIASRSREPIQRVRPCFL
ncbi:hypothetical protein Ga0100231_008315 [Opitutaceae bacterium TAV4]|nr:hypothetical protein Ga0100231_008315 [Opitutaceae bacterium TAV4]RRJ98451.1 hypothetical protein Ga0100230_008600 [Opitutaceae bacterium TAV3]